MYISIHTLSSLGGIMLVAQARIKEDKREKRRRKCVSSRPYSSAEEGVRVLGECASLRSEASAEGARRTTTRCRSAAPRRPHPPPARKRYTFLSAFPMSAQLAVNSFLALWCGRCVPIQFQPTKKLTVPPIAVSKEGA